MYMETIFDMYKLGDLEKNIFIIKTFFLIFYTYLCNFKFTNQKIIINWKSIFEFVIIAIISIVCSNIKYELL